jgi:hypothetical protein
MVADLMQIENALHSFMRELMSVAPAAGQGCYAFVGADGTSRGFVQIIPGSDRQLTIHRLWTLQPGAGNGTTMLRAICALADRLGVEIILKPLPFGRKPYRLDRDQLLAWYQRHGFSGTRRKLVRRPQCPQNAGSFARESLMP